MKLQPVQIPPRPKGLTFQVSALADPHFAADANTGLIEVFDAIGDQGTTPARISAALRSIGAKPVVVAINSPGGDVFAGLTIFNLLRGHGAGVVTQVLGIAASAASIIAMAGDEIQMARASELMIHRAQGGALGDADIMRQMASALDQVDGVMADVYAARSNLPRDQIVEMMRGEAFLTADEAVELGLATSLLERDAAPGPRLAASAAPSSKRDLEEQLRRAGFSRSVASRAAGVAWSGTRTDDDLDLEVVAAAVGQHYEAMAKSYV